MYLEIITGFNPDIPLTLKEEKLFFKKREALIKEFMPRFLTEPQKTLMKSFRYDKEEEEGFYYAFLDRKTKRNLIQFYFSDFEFGSGIRKGGRDLKMNEFKWKDFMIEKLSEISPELAKQYFDEWNKRYAEFKLMIYGNSEETMEIIERGSKRGEDIILEALDISNNSDLY